MSARGGSGRGRGRRRGPPAPIQAAPIRCYHCNQEGHIAKVCPNRAPQLCFNCGEPGHLKRDCPELHATGHGPSKATAELERQEPPLLVEITGFEEDRSKKASPSSPRPQQQQPAIRRAVSPPPQQYKPRLLSSAAAPSESSYYSQTSGAKGNLASTTFIDTHCHLEYVFERFRHQGTFAQFASSNNYPGNFGGCITTFCDPTAFSPSFGIWQSLLSEPNVWGTFGTHPHNAKYYYSSSLEEKMLNCLSHPKCVALGEIGLDYDSRSPSDPAIQKKVLTRQLELAIQLKKPIVLHCRDAEMDLFDILSSAVPSDWRIHLHCFTGSLDMGRKFLETFPNLCLGVCGNVTYDSIKVHKIAAEVPLDRLLIETDAPYMVPRNLPQHLRGAKFSHPSFAFYTAKEIAALRHTNLVDVLKSLRENTTKIYGI